MGATGLSGAGATGGAEAGGAGKLRPVLQNCCRCFRAPREDPEEKHGRLSISSSKSNSSLGSTRPAIDDPMGVSGDQMEDFLISPFDQPAQSELVDRLWSKMGLDSTGSCGWEQEVSDHEGIESPSERSREQDGAESHEGGTAKKEAKVGSSVESAVGVTDPDPERDPEGHGGSSCSSGHPSPQQPALAPVQGVAAEVTGHQEASPRPSCLLQTATFGPDDEHEEEMASGDDGFDDKPETRTSQLMPEESNPLQKQSPGEEASQRAEKSSPNASPHSKRSFFTGSLEAAVAADESAIGSHQHGDDSASLGKQRISSVQHPIAATGGMPTSAACCDGTGSDTVTASPRKPSKGVAADGKEQVELEATTAAQVPLSPPREPASLAVPQAAETHLGSPALGAGSVSSQSPPTPAAERRRTGSLWGKRGVGGSAAAVKSPRITSGLFGRSTSSVASSAGSDPSSAATPAQTAAQTQCELISANMVNLLGSGSCATDAPDQSLEAEGSAADQHPHGLISVEDAAAQSANFGPAVEPVTLLRDESQESVEDIQTEIPSFAGEGFTGIQESGTGNCCEQGAWMPEKLGNGWKNGYPIRSRQESHDSGNSEAFITSEKAQNAFVPAPRGSRSFVAAAAGRAAAGARAMMWSRAEAAVAPIASGDDVSTAPGSATSSVTGVPVSSSPQGSGPNSVADVPLDTEGEVGLQRPSSAPSAPSVDITSGLLAGGLLGRPGSLLPALTTSRKSTRGASEPVDPSRADVARSRTNRAATNIASMATNVLNGVTRGRGGTTASSASSLADVSSTSKESSTSALGETEGAGRSASSDADVSTSRPRHRVSEESAKASKRAGARARSRDHVATDVGNGEGQSSDSDEELILSDCELVPAPIPTVEERQSSTAVAAVWTDAPDARRIGSEASSDSSTEIHCSDEEDGNNHDITSEMIQARPQSAESRRSSTEGRRSSTEDGTPSQDELSAEHIDASDMCKSSRQREENAPVGLLGGRDICDDEDDARAGKRSIDVAREAAAVACCSSANLGSAASEADEEGAQGEVDSTTVADIEVGAKIVEKKRPTEVSAISFDAVESFSLSHVPEEVAPSVLVRTESLQIEAERIRTSNEHASTVDLLPVGQRDIPLHSIHQGTSMVAQEEPVKVGMQQMPDVEVFVMGEPLVEPRSRLEKPVEACRLAGDDIDYNDEPSQHCCTFAHDASLFRRGEASCHGSVHSLIESSVIPKADIQIIPPKGAGAAWESTREHVQRDEVFDTWSHDKSHSMLAKVPHAPLSSSACEISRDDGPKQESHVKHADEWNDEEKDEGIVHEASLQAFEGTSCDADDFGLSEAARIAFAAAATVPRAVAARSSSDGSRQCVGEDRAGAFGQNIGRQSWSRRAPQPVPAAKKNVEEVVVGDEPVATSYFNASAGQRARPVTTTAAPRRVTASSSSVPKPRYAGVPPAASEPPTSSLPPPASVSSGANSGAAASTEGGGLPGRRLGPSATRQPRGSQAATATPSRASAPPALAVGAATTRVARVGTVSAQQQRQGTSGKASSERPGVQQRGRGAGGSISARPRQTPQPQQRGGAAAAPIATPVPGSIAARTPRRPALSSPSADFYAEAYDCLRLQAGLL